MHAAVMVALICDEDELVGQRFEPAQRQERRLVFQRPHEGVRDELAAGWHGGGPDQRVKGQAMLSKDASWAHHQIFPHQSASDTHGH